MSEYIERGGLLARIAADKQTKHGPLANLAIAYAEANIREAPAADVAPVKRGKWVDGHCDQCGCYGEDDRVGGNIPTNFCPNCGADMR